MPQISVIQQSLEDARDSLRCRHILGVPDKLENGSNKILIDIGSGEQLEVSCKISPVAQRWWSAEYAFEDGSDNEDECVKRGWVNTRSHIWEIRKIINGVWYGGVREITILDELCDAVLAMGGSITMSERNH